MSSRSLSDIKTRAESESLGPYRPNAIRQRDANFQFLKTNKTVNQWRKLCEILGGGGIGEGTRFVGGSGGMLPQKIFKIWIPEMAFAAF